MPSTNKNLRSIDSVLKLIYQKKREYMQELIVTKNDAGQRLDKLLAKYLNKAPKSFYYKMLRKRI